MHRRNLGLLIVLCAAISVLMACDDHVASPILDFTLTDINPNSTSYDQTVSPRDYQESISAWYFGHAT